MIAILVEAALRSLALGVITWPALRRWGARNPQVESTVWITVLVVALAMPLLVQWPILHFSIRSQVVPAALATLGLPDIGAPASSGVASVLHMATARGMPFATLLPWLYLAVTATLLLRLAVGLMGTWRIARRAQPIHGGWTQGLDVRVSEEVETPVSFGRIVLLPMAWLDWPLAKRRAVISHERAHIENHDFAVQLLARLHTALFWFSPLAWWLQLRLAFLAERTSDEAATAALGSRIDYAEILLDIAVGARGLPEGIAMARPALLHRRVESLLSQKSPGFTLAPRRRLMLVLALLPSVLVIAGTAWHARAADLAPPIEDIRRHALNLPGTENFVLLRHGRVQSNAGTSAIERLMAVREGSGDALLFEDNGALYRVTDPALLDQAGALIDAVTEEGAQQAEFDRQRAELGRQHGELGRQQGAIGRQMGELGRDHARNDSDNEAFRTQMAALQQQIEALGHEHEKLGLEEAKLSIEQEQMRQQQGHDAGRAGGELQALLADALQSGKAVKVGGR